MARVVCAGHVNWDVTLRVDHLPEPDAEARIRGQSRSAGGSAANVAVGLCGLDVEATLIGSVGDDEYGSLTRRALERRDVDLELTVVDGGRTGVKFLLVDPEGTVAVLGMDGDNEAVRPADVSPALLDGADYLHLTSQRPDTAARLAELAAARGIPVSFDPGRRVTERDYGGVLERADVLFLNEREAAAFETIPEDGLVVTTYGTRGALLETPEGLYRHRGFGPVAVDSAGAGDAFAGGFLAARLRGAPPERALAVGNACGALAARERGAQVDLSWSGVASVLGEPTTGGRQQ